MRIQKIHNIKEFFKTILQCEGSVELVTSDGDRLNLRSTLCQYIAVTQMFDEDNEIEWELMLSEPKDLELLKPFIEE